MAGFVSNCQERGANFNPQTAHVGRPPGKIRMVVHPPMRVISCNLEAGHALSAINLLHAHAEKARQGYRIPPAPTILSLNPLPALPAQAQTWTIGGKRVNAFHDQPSAPLLLLGDCTFFRPTARDMNIETRPTTQVPLTYVHNLPRILQHFLTSKAYAE